MNLKDLATKPTLVKLTVDKPELVEKYGDALEFYIYDRQPLTVFGRLANADRENFGDIAMLVSTLILDEKGESIVKDGAELPFDVLTEVITMVSEHLGK